MTRPVRREPSAKAKREAARTAARPSRVLPAAWWEPGVAERMAEWLKRQKEQA